jgi:hypothetical protein
MKKGIGTDDTTYQLVCVDVVYLTCPFGMSSSSLKSPCFHFFVDNELDSAIAYTNQGQRSTAKQTHRSILPHDCGYSIWTKFCKPKSKEIVLKRF